MPLDLENIAKSNNWFLLNYEENLELVNLLDKNLRINSCEGWTNVFNKQIFIFYKSIINEGRKRFTIAHEFGHIILFHLTKLSNVEYETEANMFAARILMPACVLKECNATTPEAISKLCNTSIAAATNRFNRLRILIDRKKFYRNKLERKVYRQFKKFIKNNTRNENGKK